MTVSASLPAHCKSTGLGKAGREHAIHLSFSRFDISVLSSIDLGMTEYRYFFFVGMCNVCLKRYTSFRYYFFYDNSRSNFMDV